MDTTHTESGADVPTGKQMPLLPGWQEQKMQNTVLRLSLPWTMGAIVSVVVIAMALLLFRQSTLIPLAPIPHLSASLRQGVPLQATIVGQAGEVPVEYEEAEGTLALAPGKHHLVRVPAFIDEEVPVSLLFHPIHVKTRSFYVYKYEGTEPPFHPERFFYSRPEQLSFGRGTNFMIKANDLLYFFVGDEEVGPLTVHFDLFKERGFDPLDGRSAVCGDGIVARGSEECDDGNREHGDGCSVECRIEPVCGNRKVERDEECDDGNRGNGDGCSERCAKESVGS